MATATSPAVPARPPTKPAAKEAAKQAAAKPAEGRRARAGQRDRHDESVASATGRPARSTPTGCRRRRRRAFEEERDNGRSPCLHEQERTCRARQA